MPALPSKPIAAAALLYAALGLAANPAAALDAGALEALRAGEMRKLVVQAEPAPAPEVAYTAPDGGETTLAASNGKVRLVNFWATWCGPCRLEMPSLDALEQARGGPDFQVIAIATGRNSPEAIEDFFAETGTGLATGLDPKSALAAAMGVPGLPVTVLLDRGGNEVARLMGGAEWDSAEALTVIDALVAD